jgi:hypothetical protein
MHVRSYLTTAALALAWTVSPAGAVPEPPAAHSAQAQVSVQTGADGVRRISTVNQQFDVTRILRHGEGGAISFADVLVHQTLTREERSDVDDANVRLVSTAWMDGDRPLSRQVWTVTDHADSGRFWGGLFYITRLEPRGPGDVLDRYYDLPSGRFLFAASAEILAVDAKVYGRRRWAAFLAADALDTPGAAGESDLGWLSLVSEDGSVVSYLISTTDRGVSRYNPTWELVEARDGAPRELRLNFDSNEPQVRLPLGDGVFDLEHARLAPGFRIIRQPKGGGEPNP